MKIIKEEVIKKELLKKEDINIINIDFEPTNIYFDLGMYKEDLHNYLESKYKFDYDEVKDIDIITDLYNNYLYFSEGIDATFFEKLILKKHNINFKKEIYTSLEDELKKLNIKVDETKFYEYIDDIYIYKENNRDCYNYYFDDVVYKDYIYYEIKQEVDLSDEINEKINQIVEKEINYINEKITEYITEFQQEIFDVIKDGYEYQEQDDIIKNIINKFINIHNITDVEQIDLFDFFSRETEKNKECILINEDYNIYFDLNNFNKYYALNTIKKEVITKEIKRRLV